MVASRTTAWIGKKPDEEECRAWKDREICTYISQAFEYFKQQYQLEK
jgi:hypothetical protein